MTSHRTVPVQPGQEALGCSYELHHRREELVGGLVGAVPIIRGAFAPLRRSHVEVVRCCPHSYNQILQVVSLHSIVLMGEHEKDNS